MNTSSVSQTVSDSSAQISDSGVLTAASEPQLRVVRLIMVTDQNNNKFYEMIERADATFEVTYGRVGTAGTRKYYPIAQWDRKLKEKLRKGYQNMTHLFVLVPKNWEWEDISDERIKLLMDRLLRYSKASLDNNYLVSATEVSIQQVEAAQSILDELIEGWESKLGLGEMNELLLALYATIPRRMANVREYLFAEEEAFEEKEVWGERLAEEQATLDVMRGQVELQALNNQERKPETRMLEAMGVDISLVEDEKVIRMVKRKMGQDAQHFVRAYEIRHRASSHAFDSYTSGRKSRKKELLWHGSRNENWFSILSSGLVLRPANAIITGKMFGYGIYFADKCRKSFNYSSISGAYWTGGTQSVGFLALYEVYVGKMLKIRKHESWCYELSEKELQARGPYDSLFAKGGADLINNEYVVYRSDQCTIRYLIEVKK